MKQFGVQAEYRRGYKRKNLDQSLIVKVLNFIS